MKPIAAFLCAGTIAVSLAAAAPALATDREDEIRDRALLVHQSRGTLPPGVQPRCFPIHMSETTNRAQFQCPWDQTNGQPRLPTIRSLFGLLGRE